MPPDIEDIEIELLIRGLHQRYGYDFGDYARASLKRRIKLCQKMEGMSTISELQAQVLHNPVFFDRLIKELSINVTEMFRDPHFYLAVRDKVCPYLAPYPFLRIWHTGCSTGEEVYSMAIVLSEEGLYDRSRIYATDMNQNVLTQAKYGLFELSVMKQYSRNYHRGGGRKPFACYYTADNQMAIMDRALKRNIVFADHNLATDGVFGEMHMIVCRNVMIYFNRKLQDRVLQIFKESLCNGGFLCLGTKESIEFSSVAGDFEPLASDERIYRKKPLDPPFPGRTIKL